MRAQQIQFLTDALFDFTGKKHPLLEEEQLEQVRQLRLDEVCIIRSSGNFLTKDCFTESGIPFIHYGHLFQDYFIATTDSLSRTSPKHARLLNLQRDDLVIANASQIPAYLAQGVVWQSDEPALAGNHCTILRPLHPHVKIDPEYLSFFLHSSAFTRQRAALATGVIVSSISNRSLARVVVPVPDLETQRTIARLLYQAHDLLRHPQHGLYALRELEARRWSYYRDWLTGGDAIIK